MRSVDCLVYVCSVAHLELFSRESLSLGAFLLGRVAQVGKRLEFVQ
jgi:hypothetical protein